MEALKKKIREEGRVIGSSIIKVDSFLNHQLDARLLEQVGRELGERFADDRIDRILTVEASGIAVAVAAAPFFGWPPVVFAKKAAPNTMTDGFYEVEARSFTKGTVSTLKVARPYLPPGENVLIVDDFLAYGEASLALAKMVEEAGSRVAGIGIVIEKGFQEGSGKLRNRGYRVESLAIIDKIEEGEITFRP